MFKQWLQHIWEPKKSEPSLINVLIIEDNQLDARMIEKAVDVCGFNSLMAYDGKTGFEMALENKPELIILDYQLPDTNGGQVLKKLRLNKETSLETVVVLSAINQPEIVMESFSNGADQYLVKPVSIAFLAQQIQYLLCHPHEAFNF